MSIPDSRASGLRLLFAAAGGAAIALAGWTWLGPHSPGGESAAVIARLDAMQAEAEARDAALRREIAALRGGGAATASAPRGLRPEPHPDPRASIPLDDAAARAGMEAQRRELEAVFAADGAAPARDAAPAAIEKVFLDPGVLAAPELPVDEDVRCRARLCLISARFEQFEDGTDWAARVMMELATTAPEARVVTVPLPDGGKELRIYAARIGERDALHSP